MPGAIVVKEIKPERFKDKAFNDAIMAAAKEVARDMLWDFQATTDTWEHKVDFEVAISTQFGGPSVHVVTSDPIYGFVNNGTKRHPIFAGIFTGLSGKRALSFRNGKYKAKTRPGRIGSSPGGPTGAKIARPYVMHPGSKAREFDKAIEKRWQKLFPKAMNQAMSDAAKASGHGIP